MEPDILPTQMTMGVELIPRSSSVKKKGHVTVKILPTAYRSLLPAMTDTCAVTAAGPPRQSRLRTVGV